MKNKVLIFSATYNEAKNIVKLLNLLKKLKLKLDILIIDDNSPDFTWKIVNKYSKKNKNVKIVYNSNLEDHLINKERKGTSTILGEMDVKTVSDLIGENENYTDDPLKRLEEEEEEEERANSNEKHEKILADFKGNLTAQDKLIFNMHFYGKVKVSQIATVIHQTLYFVKKRIKNMSNDLKNLNPEKNISI